MRKVFQAGAHSGHAVLLSYPGKLWSFISDQMCARRRKASESVCIGLLGLVPKICPACMNFGAGSSGSQTRSMRAHPWFIVCAIILEKDRGAFGGSCALKCNEYERMLRHRAMELMMTPDRHVWEHCFLDSCFDSSPSSRGLHQAVQWERHSYRNTKVLRSECL